MQTTHEPPAYECPFCSWLGGVESEEKQNSDIVYQDTILTIFVAPKWWINNPGSVIVIPNCHTENLYTISDEIVSAVAIACKRVAIAMRSSYNCTGISTRQHNEPDGNQSVWHFHAHVFPRYANDRLYQNHDNKRFASPAERARYAAKLRQSLKSP
ncbi:MAG: HIT family protein [Candidatus Saccharimonas sp.]